MSESEKQPRYDYSREPRTHPILQRPGETEEAWIDRLIADMEAQRRATHETYQSKIDDAKSRASYGTDETYTQMVDMLQGALDGDETAKITPQRGTNSG